MYIHLFIHSIGTCRMRQFLAFIRSFFYSSLLWTFSCHPSPPTILQSSLTSSCHLFLGLPLNTFVSKFIHNTLLRILFFPLYIYTYIWTIYTLVCITNCTICTVHKSKQEKLNKQECITSKKQKATFTKKELRYLVQQDTKSGVLTIHKIF